MKNIPVENKAESLLISGLFVGRKLTIDHSSAHMPATLVGGEGAKLRPDSCLCGTGYSGSRGRSMQRVERRVIGCVHLPDARCNPVEFDGIKRNEFEPFKTPEFDGIRIVSQRLGRRLQPVPRNGGGSFS